MAITPRAPDLAAMLAALTARLDRLERPATSPITAGSGLPVGGTSGSYYLRTDTPGVANQQIYVNVAGTWVGIV